MESSNKTSATGRACPSFFGQALCLISGKWFCSKTLSYRPILGICLVSEVWYLDISRPRSTLRSQEVVRKQGRVYGLDTVRGQAALTDVLREQSWIWRQRTFCLFCFVFHHPFLSDTYGKRVTYKILTICAK